MTSRDVSDSRSWSELFVPERLRSCPYLHQVWECFKILSWKYEVLPKFIKIVFIFQNNRTIGKNCGCKNNATMSYCMFTYAWQLTTLILPFVTYVYKVIIFLRCWCNIWQCGDKWTNCNEITSMTPATELVKCFQYWQEQRRRVHILKPPLLPETILPSLSLYIDHLQFSRVDSIPYQSSFVTPINTSTIPTCNDKPKEYTVKLWFFIFWIYVFLDSMYVFIKPAKPSTTTSNFPGTHICAFHPFPQLTVPIEFYIHGSVHHNSVLIRPNKMQQYAGIYLLQNYAKRFGCPSHPS